MKHTNQKTMQTWFGRGQHPFMECSERCQSYFYQCCENICKEPINRSYFYQNIDFDKDIIVNCLHEFNVVQCENYNAAKIRQILFKNLPRRNKIVKVLIQNKNKQSLLNYASKNMDFNGNSPQDGTFFVTMQTETCVEVNSGGPSAGEPVYRNVKNDLLWTPVTNGVIENIIPYEWYEITSSNPYYGNTLFRIISEDSNYFVEQYGSMRALCVALPPHGSTFYSESNLQRSIRYTVKSVQYGFPEINFYNDYTDGFELHFIFEERNPFECELRIKASGTEQAQMALSRLL